LYCLTLYADLLSQSRAEKINKINRADINIIFNGKSDNYSFKQAIKWCLLWYMCEYIKEIDGESSNFYNEIIVNGLANSIKPINLDFDGGDSKFLIAILQKIFSCIVVKWRDNEIGSTYSNKTKDELYSLINDKLSEYNEEKIIFLPFFGRIPAERPYQTLFYPRNGILEGFIQGSLRHVTAFTHCNKGWLQYDNLKSSTTTSYPDGLPTNSIILQKLNDFAITEAYLNSQTSDMLILRKFYDQFKNQIEVLP
jgi:hypothetical protein